MLFCDSILIVVALEKTLDDSISISDTLGTPLVTIDRVSFFLIQLNEYALNTYPARETTNRGFREDVHRILFPCSLFFLFFFFVFSAIEPFFYPRLLDSRDKQSTLSSYRDLLFPCAKRGKETWLLVVYARHTLDQILSANFVTIDIDSTMDLCNVKSSFDSFARKKIVFS